jgi:hypothetical protein
MSFPLLIGVAVVGVATATGLMWGCARLAGVDGVTMRASLIAACGFGLPLTGAGQMLRSGTGTLGALVVLAAAIGLGLWVIRTAYGTTWNKAVLTWFLHLCVWVLIGGIMLKVRGS